MPYDPYKPQRRSIRIKGYDYSQPGSYFITICTKDRQHLFGKIIDRRMILNAFGEIVQACWLDLPNHYPHVRLGAFVVMPNHVHCNVVLIDDVESSVFVKRHGIPEIVRGFKTFSAKRINQERELLGVSVWQRNYYEHIIRNERAYLAIEEYINHNPANWQSDVDNV